MTIVVGAILILAFLAFASLMFLERLSALLALPLMAFTFLLIAVGADLVQPAEVRALRPAPGTGRAPRLEWQSGPSRFAQWQSARRQTATALHETAENLATTVAMIRAAVNAGSERLADRLGPLVRECRQADETRRAAARAAIQPVAGFFAKPPLYPGPAADVETRLQAIPTGTFLAAVEAAVAAPGGDVTLPARLEPILAQGRRDADTARAQQPPPPAASRWATLLDAGHYLVTALFLLFRAGSLSLYATIIATLFGGMFAMYIKQLGVVERLVYWTAEFAGERPLVISLAVFLVTAVIFSSVGGLGTVIMLGTIILPILRSLGLSPIVSAGVFLLGISMGGTLQPVSRRLWLDFYGLPAAELDRLLWTMVGVYFVCGVGWILWGTRRGLLSSFDAEPAAAPPPAATVPARLMVAPLIPVGLVYFLGVEELSAFTLSIAYMFVCVCRRTGAARVLARSLIEGAQTVVPPVLLMVGIGMLVVALGTEPVQSYLRPLLLAAVPSTRPGYIALFALAAPLALYRGPLNVWGMGLAISAMLLTAGALPAAAVLGAILAAGMVQGVCDPTNTANVWIAGFQGVTVNQILRYTLLPVWLAAAGAVVIFGLWYVS